MKKPSKINKIDVKSNFSKHNSFNSGLLSRKGSVDTPVKSPKLNQKMIQDILERGFLEMQKRKSSVYLNSSVVSKISGTQNKKSKLAKEEEFEYKVTSLETPKRRQSFFTSNIELKTPPELPILGYLPGKKTNLFHHNFDSSFKFRQTTTQQCEKLSLISPAQLDFTSFDPMIAELILDFQGNCLNALYNVNRKVRRFLIEKFKKVANEVIDCFQKKHFELLAVNKKGFSVSVDNGLAVSAHFSCIVIGNKVKSPKTVHLNYMTDIKFVDCILFDLVPDDAPSRYWIFQDQNLVVF